MGLLVNAYSTLVSTPAMDCSCKLISHNDLKSGDLSVHLDSLVKHLAEAGQGKVTSTARLLCYFISRVKNHFVFELEQDELADFAQWALSANAICYFPDGSIRDPLGHILQSADGKIEKGAFVPYPEDALKRRKVTTSYLNSLGLDVSKELAPVFGEEELILRSVDEVIDRSLALMLVGIQAEAFAENKPNDPKQFERGCPRGYAALTDKERSFINSESVDKQLLVNMFWRYESAMALQWAFGLQPKLVISGKTSDRVDIVDKGLSLFDTNRVFTVRSSDEILSTFDLYHCLHWLVLTTKSDNKLLVNEVNRSVIRERHYALSWLIRFSNNQWD